MYPLTKYASENPIEGFAELITGVVNGWDHLKPDLNKFPKAMQFLKDNGILKIQWSCGTR